MVRTVPLKRLPVALVALLALAAAPVPGPDDAPDTVPGAAVEAPALDAEQVRRLQGALTELGLYSGAVSGRYDRTTEEAVRVFRRDAGMPSGAPVDAAFLKKIEARAEAARLIGNLREARAAAIEQARAALLSDPATRDLVGGPPAPADPTRDASACLAAPTVRCLLAEAEESAKAVADSRRRDWAFADILAVAVRAGLDREARATLRHFEDPRRILQALRDMAVATARSGDVAAGQAAARAIPDADMRAQALAAIDARAPGEETAAGRVDGDASDVAPRFRAIRLIERAGTATPEEARRLLAEAETQIESIDTPLRRGYPRLRLAAAWAGLIGRAEAPDAAARAKTVARALDAPAFRARAFARLATAHRRAGPPQAAVSAEAAALGALAAVPTRLRQVWTAAEMAEAAAADGDRAGADAYLDTARRLARDYRTPWGRARALARLAEGYLAAAEARDGTQGAAGQ